MGSLEGLGSRSGLAEALVCVSGETKCHHSCSGGIIRRREEETGDCDHMYTGKDR